MTWASYGLSGFTHILVKIRKYRRFRPIKRSPCIPSVPDHYEKTNDEFYTFSFLENTNTICQHLCSVLKCGSHGCVQLFTTMKLRACLTYCSRDRGSFTGRGGGRRDPMMLDKPTRIQKKKKRKKSISVSVVRV